MNRVADFIMRPLMQARSAAVLRSTGVAVRPAGLAHTRAPGPWPLHILFIGCGVAVGEGVLTHDLGIPGHLARLLAADIARGVDIDIVVDPEMTPTSALSTLSRIRLSPYDAIVIVLGAADAAQLSPVATWGRDFRRLLAHIRDTASPDSETFVVTIPESSQVTGARFALSAVAERHASRLITQMEESCAEAPATSIVHLTTVESGSHQPATSFFRELGRQVSTPMSRVLNLAPGSSVRKVDVSDEIARQKAVDDLQVIGEAASERLDRITELAQQAFGVTSAAVTIIDGQWQLYASRQSIDMTQTPRNDALCAVTITGRDALIVADASIDPRFADNPLVTGEPHIRFYAGYPIEAPNGERVGALCVLDDQPREFTEENVIQLRTLALFAQDELWLAGYHYEREFRQHSPGGQADDLLGSGFTSRLGRATSAPDPTPPV